MKEGTLNYSSREKRWKAYYKLEQKTKKIFFNKISAGDGFKILKELHQFVYNLKDKAGLEKLDMTKIKTLAKTHSIFGKVKQ